MAGNLLRITPATLGDLDAVRTLQKVLFPQDTYVSPTVAHTLVVRSPVNRVLVAFSMARVYSTAHEQGLVVDRQGVSPSHRGMAIQQRMLARHEKDAIAAGLPEVWSYCHALNYASANSFIARGFRLWRPVTWDGVTLSTHETEFLYFRKRVIQ